MDVLNGIRVIGTLNGQRPPGTDLAFQWLPEFQSERGSPYDLDEVGGVARGGGARLGVPAALVRRPDDRADAAHRRRVRVRRLPRRQLAPARAPLLQPTSTLGPKWRWTAGADLIEGTPEDGVAPLGKGGVGGGDGGEAVLGRRGGGDGEEGGLVGDAEGAEAHLQAHLHPHPVEAGGRGRLR